AEQAGLGPSVAKVYVPIKPLCEDRPKKADDRKREKMEQAQAEEEWPVMDKGSDAQNYKQRAQNHSGAEGELHQGADKVQTEKQDKGSRNGRHSRPILLKKCPDSTCCGAERNEHDGETDDKGERGSEQTSPRLLTLAQLLHADAGEHRDVSGNEREYAGRQKRNQPGDKRGC